MVSIVSSQQEASGAFCAKYACSLHVRMGYSGYSGFVPESKNIQEMSNERTELSISVFDVICVSFGTCVMNDLFDLLNEFKNTTLKCLINK